MEKYIQVLWDCGRGADCTNKERPGSHGDRDECGECLGIPKPAPVKPAAPILQYGRSVPAQPEIEAAHQLEEEKSNERTEHCPAQH